MIDRYLALLTPVHFIDHLSDPVALAMLNQHSDGLVYPHEAAEAMGITEAEVRRLAWSGALEVRGARVRPALVWFVDVRR